MFEVVGGGGSRVLRTAAITGAVHELVKAEYGGTLAKMGENSRISAKYAVWEQWEETVGWCGRSGQILANQYRKV